MRAKRILVFSIFCAVLFLSYIPSIFGPGLDSPQSIGPYLNGAFPDQAPDPNNNSYSYVIEDAFPNLTFIDPLKMLSFANGDSMMVIGKPGYIWVFLNSDTVTQKRTILDISNQVVAGEDGGLLGLVFHPEFRETGSSNKDYLYLWYRYAPVLGVHGNFGYMRLSRFTYSSDTEVIDPGSEFVMIQQYDRHDWHNGGDLLFGTDGYLYVAVGDEGSSNDAYDVSQRIDYCLFGGVFRIDVDMNPATSHPIRRQPQNSAPPPSGWPNSFTQGYYIPNDNPWLATDGSILEEFYALGLRSPHRMTLDSLTGIFWLGDVGQGKREEVNKVRRKGNFQWPYREGDLAGPKPQPTPLIGNDSPPFYSYKRSFGRSVIGGYVYRGNKYPELTGKYVFADHEVQNIWTLPLDSTGGDPEPEFLLNVPTAGVGGKDGISSFYLGPEGTLYILDLYGTNLDGGKIHKLVRKENTVPNPSSTLTGLGAFTDLTTLTPAPGVIPYSVNAPFWTDRSEKMRWIALPNDGVHNFSDEKITFDSERNWKFPPGTVLIKHFELPIDENNPSLTKRLETRFVVFDSEGGAYALTYQWNDEGTEAFLLPGSDTKDIVITEQGGGQYIQSWYFPSRQQCLECHNSVAGYALGVKTRQINGEITYPSTGITANQLETWNHLGMFDHDIGDPRQYPRSTDITDGEASKEFRVRSYLDGNCSYCHRPNGVQGVFDSRGLSPLYNQAMINATGISNASPTGSKIVIPADPQQSQLYVRDNSIGSNSMPPIGKNIVDTAYTNRLFDWIADLDADEASDITEGWYFLKARHSRKLLGSFEKRITAGEIIVQQDSTDEDHQKWYVQHAGNNKYRLINAASKFSLATETMLNHRGINVTQEVRSNQQNQFWYFEVVDSGYYNIKNAYNGLSMDILGGISTEGGNAINWTPYDENHSQQFYLLPTTTPSVVCENESTIYLSDLEWVGEPIVGGNKTVGKDQSVSQNTLTINGNTYTKGIGTHAYSEIVYNLEGKYDRFLCDIGIDDNSGDGSVIFKVYVNDNLAYDSGVLTQTDNAVSIDVIVAGGYDLKLVVESNGGIANDHANWADARLITCEFVDCQIPAEDMLTDLSWEGTPQNGLGPPEIDKSNGGAGSNDGAALQINDVIYQRGLGVHPYSEIKYSLDGKYQKFSALIGVDDLLECTSSVSFEVYVDDILVYQSQDIFFRYPATPIEIDVTGALELKLVVNNTGVGTTCNANWVDTKLEYCDDTDYGIFTDFAEVGSSTGNSSGAHVDGVYTLVGHGNNLGNTADEFQFLYKDHDGDGEIIARAKSLENTNNFAKSGLMFRGNANDNSPFAYVAVRPDKTAYFLWRKTQGGGVDSTAAMGGTFNAKYLRLTRHDDTFAAYYSTQNADGPWEKIGSVVINMPQMTKIGLALTANNSLVVNKTRLDYVRIIEKDDPKPIYISAKVYLQGPWNGIDMNTNLSTSELLPLAQPYSSLPWNHKGTECMEKGAFPVDVVDWVILQIRDPNDSAKVLMQRACFVRKDGILMDLDGTENIFFGKWPLKSGFVSIIHRNHLAVMTNEPVIF